MIEYASYMELTLTGSQGNTAQFGITKYLHTSCTCLYLLFHRACRITYLDLFIYTLVLAYNHALIWEFLTKYLEMKVRVN